MQLAPPNVLEPLSVCSRRVRLGGQVQGAKVALRGANDRPLGAWVATWPDELFDLDPGVTLAAGEPVSVMQTRGPDSSDWSSIPVAVQEAGESNPLIVLPVTACSSEVEVRGLAPGATATVRDKASNTPLGTSKGGTVEVVTLSRALNQSDHLDVTVTACAGGPGPTSAEPTIEALKLVDPRERRLPKVVLEQPLRECQRLLVVHGGQPGTDFFLQRDDGSTVSWPLHAESGRLRVDPLRTGEKLTWWVDQADRRCEAQQSEEESAEATSDRLPPPSISTEPCPGSPLLGLHGLVPGATVRLRVDGSDALEMEASGTDQDLDIGALTLVAGQRLTVVQRLCNDWSDASPGVVVAVAPDRMPKIVEPLVACSSTVVVEDVDPGATVLVLSERLGLGELGRAVAGGTKVAVGISPYLKDPDTIVVRVLGCHPAELKAPVAATVDLPEPVLQQAYVGTRTLVVTQLVPGSWLDVVVSGHHVASVAVTEESADVHLTDPLIPEDLIELVARLCTMQRRTEPQPPTAPPTPAYALHRVGGIDTGGGNWASGQVEVALGAPGDVLVLGCREAGVWISHPDGSAEPVGYGWADPQVLGLAADPTNPLHIFAATWGGLRETDPGAADPLHTWRDVTLPGAAGVNLSAVAVTDDRVVVIAATSGVWWSPIPGPGGVWSFQTDPAVATSCSGLVVTSGGVVAAAPGAPAVAAPEAPAVPPRMFRGESTAGTLLWSEHTNTVPAAFAARQGRTVLASCETDRKTVYSLAADNANDMFLGVLRSQDGGRSWVCPHLPVDPDLTRFQLEQPWDMRLQAPRDLGVAVHPTNPMKVILAGRRERLLGSTDGAATFDSDGYPDILNTTFHADSRLITYDRSTGTTRLLVGNDGGIFVSTDEDGRSFDSSRNRGLSTLMVAQSPSPSMASAPDVPGSCSAGLQDNGEVWTVPGQTWRQFEGGDGERQVVVLGRFLLHSGNDAPPLRWCEITAAGPGASHEVKRPTTGPLPRFESYLTAAEGSSWRNAAGHLLVAHAAEMSGPAPVTATDPAQVPTLYGIYLDPGGGDSLFYGELLTVLPGPPTGVGSYDGRVAVVGTTDKKGNSHVYRFDAAGNTLIESVLPAGFTAEAQFPTLWAPRAGAMLCGGRLLLSDNLQTWSLSPADTSLTGITGIAVDTAEHPPAIHAGTETVVRVVRDAGNLLSPVAGLPKHARVKQLVTVADSAGSRWVYLGSWAWSIWRAQLG